MMAISCRNRAREKREYLKKHANEFVANSPIGLRETKRNKKKAKKNDDREIDSKNFDEEMEQITDNTFDLETNSRTTLDETQDSQSMKRRNSRKRRANESDSSENDSGNYKLDGFMQSDEGGT